MAVVKARNSSRNSKTSVTAKLGGKPNPNNTLVAVVVPQKKWWQFWKRPKVYSKLVKDKLWREES